MTRALRLCLSSKRTLGRRTDRDICSIDVAFCSTDVLRLSVIAPTSSIDAAICVIDVATWCADVAMLSVVARTA